MTIGNDILKSLCIGRLDTKTNNPILVLKYKMLKIHFCQGRSLVGKIEMEQFPMTRT